MDFDSALQAHQDWKIKLRSAISSQATLDAGTIGKDDCCALGKWLYGEAKGKHAALPAYRECLAAHTAFHREAGRIAGLINEKKYADAEKALGAGTPYTAASGKVGVSIVQMRRATAA